MVRLIVLIVLISFGLLESNAQSAKSDSLFAIGVDLYNAGKYAYSGDSRSPIPMISVHSVGDLLYRRQS